MQLYLFTVVKGLSHCTSGKGVISEWMSEASVIAAEITGLWSVLLFYIAFSVEAKKGVWKEFRSKTNRRNEERTAG